MEAGINCPWYVFFLAAVCLITVLTYRGIEISAICVMWLTGVEILIGRENVASSTGAGPDDVIRADV